MKIVTRSRFFFLAALAVAAVGCGGGGSNPTTENADGDLNYVGSTPLPSNTSADAVVPATGGVNVQTGEGASVIPSGAAPAGSTVESTDTVAILEEGFGFPGVFGENAQIAINGVANSGALVGPDGLSDQQLAFPVSEAGTPYTLSFPVGTLDTRALTVQRFELTGKWYVNFEPLSFSIPVPTGLSGTIPNNGQNAVGSDVTATFLPGCNGRTATLRVDYGNGFVLQQTKVIAANSARFNNLTTDSTNVPGVGVELVRLSVGDR